MKTSIKTIQFVGVLCIVLLLIAYITSLNIEKEFVLLNIFCISNNFIFTIVGGAFASLLVILVTEFQKYFLIKHQTEDVIYRHLVSLYIQVTIIHYNIQRHLNNDNIPVPENLIDEIANRGQICLNSLSSTDYITFGKCGFIKNELSLYKGENGFHIRYFLQNTTYLKMALHEDKIAMLMQERDQIVTSSSPKTNLTLKKIFEDSSIILTYVEKSLDKIDAKCDKRYHWHEIKKSIISFEEDFVSSDLDSFLKLPKIKFE